MPATWEWELLAGPATITEGPAWDGARLFFTSIADSEIRRFDPQTGQITTVYRDTGSTNGLTFGPDGSLYACASTDRAIHRYAPDGTRHVLAERFEGRRLNSPNDLILDAAGRVWFTDPRYGDDHSDRELDHDSVYRLTPPASGDGAWQIERMTFDTTRPNGLLLAPDGQTLYVAQSDYNMDEPRQLRAYPVRADGTLGPYTVLHDFGNARGIDGMRWDREGTIVAACGWELGGPGPRIAIFATDGALLEEHPLPAGRPSNCAFGGPALDVLFITTIDGRLYRVPNTGRTGLLPPPAERPFIGG